MLKRCFLATLCLLSCAASIAQTLPGNVNFNNSNPAPPTGYYNVTWQQQQATNAVNLTAYVSETANVPVCNQTADTANAYACSTIPPAIDATGATFLFIPQTLNTGPATLDVNGALTAPIYNTPTTLAPAGSLQPGTPVFLTVATINGSPAWLFIGGATTLTELLTPPVSGQYAVIYPQSSATSPCGSSTVQATNSSGSINYVYGGSGSCPSTITWTFGALPSYINPSAVTAVYAATVASAQPGVITNAGDSTLICGPGSATVANGTTLPLQQYTVLTAMTGSQVNTSTCTASVNGSVLGPKSTSFTLHTVAYLVYYTGTASTNATALNVAPPLYYNPASNMLGLNLPDNFGQDVGTTNAYAATVPSTNLTFGTSVTLAPAAANTTTTPTFNLDGFGALPIVGPQGNAVSAGDISTSVPALLSYGSNGTTGEWYLQDPQVSGATGTAITALTGDVTATGPGAATAALSTTSVTPGSYTCANVTVNSKGRLTAAASGSCGGGSGFPSAPAIVQSAFLRAGGGSQTITLGSTPTIGNTLVWIYAGGGTAGAPAGFATLYNCNGCISQSQTYSISVRLVQSGDGAAYTYSASDNNSSGVFEVSGEVALSTANQPLAANGNQLLCTVNTRPGIYSISIIETDNEQHYSSIASGATLLFDGTLSAGHSGLWFTPSNTTLGSVATINYAGGSWSYPGCFDVMLQAY
jgi:hypothetical protein